VKDSMPTGKDKPTLLIITGPQGSGNHLFSKIFSLHKEVLGWSALYDHEWVGHDQEIFQPYWNNPKTLSDFDWSQSKYYVTSISCPYVLNKKFAIPKYHAFINQAKKYADVQVAIIGRDKNILKHQQIRVRRGEHTTPVALQHLSLLPDAFYLSQELFFLYGKNYLKNICKLINFPIDYNNVYITKLFKNEANKKYIKKIKKGPFDDIQMKINY